MVRFFGKRKSSRETPKLRKKPKSRRLSPIARARQAIARKLEARRNRKRPLTAEELKKIAEDTEKEEDA